MKTLIIILYVTINSYGGFFYDEPLTNSASAYIKVFTSAEEAQESIRKEQENVFEIIQKPHAVYQYNLETKELKPADLRYIPEIYIDQGKKGE